MPVATGRRAIAVIGAGISGLTAAHILSRSRDVTPYRADGRQGRHAHTHNVASAGGLLAVDSGFIVHNEPVGGQQQAERRPGCQVYWRLPYGNVPAD